MNDTFKSELTLLHLGAIMGKSGKIKVPLLDIKFHVSNSRNKKNTLNGTSILPDLPIMAPKCSSVSSDLNASFKRPGKKKGLLKVSEKYVKN